MNRKGKKKSSTEAVTPYRSFPLEPGPPNAHILRLNWMIQQIETHVKAERKKAAPKERSKLRVIFRGADDLWQRREAWIKAHGCCLLITSGKAANLFNLSSPEQHFARTHFERMVDRVGNYYLQALAERWKGKVIEEIENEPDFLKLKQSFIPPDESVQAFDQHMNELFLILMIDDEFDRYCWPQLPEKHILKSYLQTNTKSEYLERTFKLFWSLPKAGKHALVEWFHIKPDDARELIGQEQGLGKYAERVFAKFKKPRPTKRQTENAERKKRYKKAREKWSQFLKLYGEIEEALHQLIIFLDEPNYDCSHYRARGNGRIRAGYKQALGLSTRKSKNKNTSKKNV